MSNQHTKKYFLVPANVRYKEFYAVKVEVGPGDMGDETAQDAVVHGLGTEDQSLREYVEQMDCENWDEPWEISEEEYKAHGGK